MKLLGLSLGDVPTLESHAKQFSKISVQIYTPRARKQRLSSVILHGKFLPSSPHQYLCPPLCLDKTMPSTKPGQEEAWLGCLKNLKYFCPYTQSTSDPGLQDQKELGQLIIAINRSLKQGASWNCMDS